MLHSEKRTISSERKKHWVRESSFDSQVLFERGRRREGKKTGSISFKLPLLTRKRSTHDDDGSTHSTYTQTRSAFGWKEAKDRETDSRMANQNDLLPGSLFEQLDLGLEGREVRVSGLEVAVR